MPNSGENDFRAVGALLDEMVASGALPGAGVLIRHGGAEVFYHQAGLSDVAEGKPMARDTIVRLFSMTKPVTVAAVMMLVEDGVLRLDDLLGDYVPELAQLGVYAGRDGDRVRTEPAGPIRIHHLLTHTAGFSAWFQPEEPVAALYRKDKALNDERWRFEPALGGSDGFVRAIAQQPLVCRPGERWHYGMALDVAGVVVERVSGEGLDAFMARRIFQPLGMVDAGFWVPPDKADRLASLYKPRDGGGFELAEAAAESELLKPVPGMAGGGGLACTVDDFSRFAELLRAGGVANGVQLLSTDAVRGIMTDQLRPAQLDELPGMVEWGLGGAGDGAGFGLGGIVVREPPADGQPASPGEYSWGGAASTTFWVDPANDLTVVFTAQLQPLIPDTPRGRLHRAVYAHGAPVQAPSRRLGSAGA